VSVSAPAPAPTRASEQSSPAAFEFHTIDLIRDPPSDELIPIMPEVKKLIGRPLLCVYGSEEPDTLCKDLDSKKVRVVELKGGHHFGGHYQTIADYILDMLKSKTSR
jgi:type IV secretory pathway VirJ component